MTTGTWITFTTILFIVCGIAVVLVITVVAIATFREARDLHLRPSELEQGSDECGDE